MLHRAHLATLDYAMPSLSLLLREVGTARVMAVSAVLATQGGIQVPSSGFP
jgi:hypothetical protein